MISSPYHMPEILPPDEHPRLLLREKDLHRIRENICRPENLMAAELYRSLLATPISAKGATPEYGTYHLKEALSAEARAFRALLSGAEEDAREAIEAIFLLLQNFTVKDSIMGARWGGHLIFAASLVYDWCYEYLTKEQKTQIIAFGEKVAENYFEMGYPPAGQSPISGHGAEAQLLRDLLAFSVAVYDERPDIYHFCAGRIFQEYVPALEQLLRGGAHNQGPAYGSYRYTCLTWAELIFRTMSGQHVFKYLDRVADWLLYITRPDGQALRLGDDFNEKKAAYNYKAPFTVPLFYAYALTGYREYYDAYSKGICPSYLVPTRFGLDYYIEGSWGEGLVSPVSILLFDRLTEPREYRMLPNCRYFGFPVGETVFKKDNTMVFMKIGQYWGANHDHFDTGCFQLFCGVPLLTDSGVYDQYFTPHRLQYLIHTHAHNCLTVGEASIPANGREPGTIGRLLSDEYHMADILCHKESETGCYLSGDLTRAYRRTCSKVIRSMEYDHAKATFTVHDEVDSLQPELPKVFHLHCLTEPEIEGNMIRIENNGHTAVCRVLAPENAVITKLAGFGDYPPEDPGIAEIGWGEIRITPSAAAIHDEFLVKIELA